MGVPTKIKNTFSINALPIRAYVMIWNEFFRDENVGNAAVIKTTDEDVVYSTGTANASEKEATEEIRLKNAINGGFCLPVNKFHDYFTSCLPYPQRGPAVTLPIQGNAEVKAYKGLPKEENEVDMLVNGFNIGATPSTRAGTLNGIASEKIRTQYNYRPKKSEEKG